MKQVELSPKQDETFTLWQQRHDQFIRALFIGCQSDTLIRLRRMLYDQCERYRCVWFSWSVYHNPSTFGQFSDYHQHFVDAVMIRDAKLLITS